jgi:hypothetical protein
MIQKEIIEYNKRCAEFLGAEVNDILERIYIDKMKDDEMIFHNHSVTLQTYEWNGTTNIHYIPFDMLQFHSDWNWIHEITTAINKTQNPKQSGDTTHSTLKREVQALLGKSAKEAVVQAINQFLIWYNENKN